MLTWIIIDTGHGDVLPNLSRCIVLLPDAIFSSFAKLCRNNVVSAVPRGLKCALHLASSPLRPGTLLTFPNSRTAFKMLGTTYFRLVSHKSTISMLMTLTATKNFSFINPWLNPLLSTLGSMC